MDGGSLDQLLQCHDRHLSWRTRISLMLDVARGMRYLHSTGFMHRDLTSRVRRNESNFV